LFQKNHQIYVARYGIRKITKDECGTKCSKKTTIANTNNNNNNDKDKPEFPVVLQEALGCLGAASLIFCSNWLFKLLADILSFRLSKCSFGLFLSFLFSARFSKIKHG